MRSYIGSLWVSVVCAVVLSGAPGVAVADEVNPSSVSSVTTTGPTAMITPTLTTSELSSSEQLAISVSPTSGFPGTPVMVRGTGWTHQVYADGVEVEISQNYGNGQLTRLTSARSGPPDANGAFSLRMTIPATAKPGLLSISPITGGPEIADALFTVTGGGVPSGQAHPSVTLSPPNGPAKTVTTADGHGFNPNQPVTVIQSGGPQITGGGGTVQADASGSIKMSFRIADQTPPGAITVTFTQGPNTATAQFQVTAPPPNQGNGGSSPGSPNTSAGGGGSSPTVKVPDLRTIGALVATAKFDVQLYQCLTGNDEACIESTLELLGVTLPLSQAEQVRNLLRANLVATCGVGIIAALPTGGSTVAACGPLALQAFIEALSPEIVYSR